MSGTERASRRDRPARAARLWRGAGLVWLVAATLAMVACLVVRLETATSEDPWEDVAGWDSQGSLLTDVLVGGLLISPTIVAMRIANRLDRAESASRDR